MTTKRYDDAGPGVSGRTGTLAAVFAQREAARAAASRLHDEGFRRIWTGTTRSDISLPFATALDEADARVPADDEMHVEPKHWIERVLGLGDMSLHEALREQGVSEPDARTLSMPGAIPDACVVLTVDADGEPERAARIILACDGRIANGGAAHAPGDASTAVPIVRDEYAAGGTSMPSPGKRRTLLRYDAADEWDDRQRP